MAVDHDAEIDDVNASGLTLSDRDLPWPCAVAQASWRCGFKSSDHLTGQEVDDRDASPAMVRDERTGCIEVLRLNTTRQNQGSKSCRN
jgi:hypothetical protein